MASVFSKNHLKHPSPETASDPSLCNKYLVEIGSGHLSGKPHTATGKARRKTKLARQQTHTLYDQSVVKAGYHGLG